jgi:hypothetical protein
LERVFEFVSPWLRGRPAVGAAAATTGAAPAAPLVAPRANAATVPLVSRDWRTADATAPLHIGFSDCERAVELRCLDWWLNAPDEARQRVHSVTVSEHAGLQMRPFVWWDDEAEHARSGHASRFPRCATLTVTTRHACGGLDATLSYFGGEVRRLVVRAGGYISNPPSVLRWLQRRLAPAPGGAPAASLALTIEPFVLTMECRHGAGGAAARIEAAAIIVPLLSAATGGRGDHPSSLNGKVL